MRLSRARIRASLDDLALSTGLQGRARADGGAAEGAGQSADGGELLDSALLRRIEKLRITAPRSATAGLVGEHAGRRGAHVVEFARYRPYMPGDDLRLVDWNVYARLGELCVKLGDARENLRVHLLLDCSASMDWGQPNKLLYAKRVAAALGALALVGYDTVYLGTCSSNRQGASPPLRGRPALGSLLTYLQDLTPDPATDLARATASYCASHRGRGIAVLLTDCMVPGGPAEALRHLDRAGLRTTLLHILDEREQRPDLDGPLALRDCETGEIVRVAMSADLRRRYATQFQSWSDELASACSAHRAGYVQVSTAVPPATLILGILAQRGVLR